MKRVVFSNTHDIENYVVSDIPEEEFVRLEALRGDALWVVVGPADEGGHRDTYHGPAD